MISINAYINFPGTARDAMGFYKECFGGELMIQNVAGSAMETNVSAERKDQVLHASLHTDRFTIMASDMTWRGYTQGDHLSLSVNCESEEEINSLFEKFSEGGTVHHPLEDSFWGARFGVLSDKFGIRWMFNYEKDKK